MTVFQRGLFLLSCIFLSFFLWKCWKSRFLFFPKINNFQTNVQYTKPVLKKKKIIPKKIIHLYTDVLSLKINLIGGNIDQADLLCFKKKIDDDIPLRLLQNDDNKVYKVVLGFLGKDRIKSIFSDVKKPLYSSKKSFFKLKSNENRIKVPIVRKCSNGLIFTKTFILNRGSYNVEVEYKVENNTNHNIEVSMFGEIHQTINLDSQKKSMFTKNISSKIYQGTAYSSDLQDYKKHSFLSIKNGKNLNFFTKRGWIAMLQQYFATAWIPKNIENYKIYSKKIDDSVAVIGMISKNKILKPHSSYKSSASVWIGPEIQEDMSKIAKNLDFTVDYGWFWFLSKPLFKILTFFYNIFKNWGIAIIFITLLIKIITYPLSKSQYVSMIKMKKIQPKIEEIKNKYKGDSKKIGLKIIELYKKEQVNPLGSFLPIIIQTPVFLALYHVLVSSIELRHAPFLGWIKDLSSQDPYYILPILMGITALILQIISSDIRINNIRKKIIYIMIPIVFTLFFVWLPSGLVLYYLVNNIITIIQQQWISMSLKLPNNSIKNLKK